MHNAGWLGDSLDVVLPGLGELLDDQEWRDKALEQLAFGFDRQALPDPLTEQDREILLREYKERLRELGHMPLR